MTNSVITFRPDTQVCTLGMGTWNLGDSAAKEAEEIEALRTGIELGMQVIDTAEMYGRGRSERLVGKAIRGIRDQVFLISKVLPQHANREGTKAACEASLKRLDTGYLDLYLLHWGGPYPIRETIDGMLELQQEGKIRQWGVSNMDVDMMEEFFALSGGETCAADEVLYNLTRRGVEYDLLPWCEAHQLPLIAYSPVEQGRLLGQPVLREIARRHGASPAQVALAWVLRRPGVLAIPKASTSKHVRENFGSLSIELTKRDLTELDAVFPAPTRKHLLEVI